MSLKQLAYASAAVAPFDDDSLEALLQVARNRNSARHISGLLLYHQGAFFQILEGGETEVEALFEQIEKDPRHSNSTVILRRDIDQRNFGDWSMGFHKLTKASTVPVDGFVDLLRVKEASDLNLAGNTRTAERMIDAFRDGRWRPSVRH
jgi:hypothetical protein